MLIDAHVHVGPWRLPGLEGLTCTFEEAVDAALVEGIEGLVATRSDGATNEEVRQAIAEEGRIRLWYAAWIRPGSKDAEDCADAPGSRLAALKLHPSIDRAPVTDAGYDPAFDLAVEEDLPIIIHTGRWQEVAGFEHALSRAEQHRGARIILAHAGGNDFGLRQRCIARIVDLGLENVWLDLTGLGMPLLTKKLVARLGYERFLFGSDYPLGHPRVQIAHMTAMDLPPTETAAILGGTAERILWASVEWGCPVKVSRVSGDDFLQGARSLIVGEPCRPPELSLRTLGPAETEYLLALRHGGDGEAVGILCEDQGKILAAAAVQPSPFDADALGVPSARMQAIYAASAEAAREVVPHVLDAARHMGARLLLGRIAPDSLALGALLDAGLDVFGGNTLYAGTPAESPMPSGTALLGGAEAIDEAASIVSLAFRDTHLSRDPRIDRSRAPLVYERWLAAESERGATVVVSREERGHAAAVAVCRKNDLARKHLKLDLWNLHLLATHPAWSGRGYGNKAAKAALSFAATQGATLAQTGVDIASIHAQRVYIGLGMRPASSSLALHGWLD